MIKDDRQLKKIEAELADVVVYCISLSNVLGTDLSKAILKKVDENEKKYPIEKTKGSYKKYTQL